MTNSDLRELTNFFMSVRSQTEAICAPLEVEDYVLQCMDDVSPPKWHLAHVSWFFEEFILKPFSKSYREFDPHFCFLFNSYYNAVGNRHPRPKRGHLSRPVLRKVIDYRRYINENMQAFLSEPAPLPEEVVKRTIIGLHHEKQHQELLFTDIKYNLSCNPLFPAYCPASQKDMTDLFPGHGPLEWLSYQGGTTSIGAASDGFAYDNERPRHQRLVLPFAMASRAVTNSEYREFIEAGGYRKPEFWLSDGWDLLQKEGWQAPLYWRHIDGVLHEYTLSGLKPLDPNALVSHVSFYEAEAFAQFSGYRLPYESEWEFVAQDRTPTSYFILDREHWQPIVQNGGADDLFGTGWQWTIDAYLPYPGFQPESGALGEYNGKFMCNQKVLRGGSMFTPKDHIRPTYRNFFPPAARWQKTQIRLAKAQ